ncbi:hypothetical protein M0804_004967 [Polistes exclamans]|nr:hypothetical protein M0804_004967 [Polistes exclamans]
MLVVVVVIVVVVVVVVVVVRIEDRIVQYVCKSSNTAVTEAAKGCSSLCDELCSRDEDKRNRCPGWVLIHDRAGGLVGWVVRW